MQRRRRRQEDDEDDIMNNSRSSSGSSADLFQAHPHPHPDPHARDLEEARFKGDDDRSSSLSFRPPVTTATISNSARYAMSSMDNTEDYNFMTSEDEEEISITNHLNDDDNDDDDGLPPQPPRTLSALMKRREKLEQSSGGGGGGGGFNTTNGGDSAHSLSTGGLSSLSGDAPFVLADNIEEEEDNDITAPQPPSLRSIDTSKTRAAKVPFRLAAPQILDDDAGEEAEDQLPSEPMVRMENTSVRSRSRAPPPSPARQSMYLDDVFLQNSPQKQQWQKLQEEHQARRGRLLHGSMDNASRNTGSNHRYSNNNNSNNNNNNNASSSVGDWGISQILKPPFSEEEDLEEASNNRGGVAGNNPMGGPSPYNAASVENWSTSTHSQRNLLLMNNMNMNGNVLPLPPQQQQPQMYDYAAGPSGDPGNGHSFQSQQQQQHAYLDPASPASPAAAQPPNYGVVSSKILERMRRTSELQDELGVISNYHTVATSRSNHHKQQPQQQQQPPQQQTQPQRYATFPPEYYYRQCLYVILGTICILVIVLIATIMIMLLKQASED